MLVEHDLDPASLYEVKRHELVAIVRACAPDDIGRLVPATPAWTVHDVLAHVVGIAADLNAQRFGTGDPDAWTAEQVERRRGTTVDELADEWDREAPRFVDGLRLFGYELGSHYVADLLQHTADVRHAVGAGPIADDDALLAALDFYIDHLHRTLTEHGRGSIRLDVRAGTEDRGGPTRSSPTAVDHDGQIERIVVGPNPTVAALTVDRVELFRALGGRRSEGQIRALRWTGDLEPVVGLLSAYPMPTRDLVEPLGRGDPPTS